MHNSMPGQDNFFKLACLFEASLALVALLLGWIFDIDPFNNLKFSETALANGILATLPLLLLFFIMQELPYAPIRKIKALLLETLGSRLYRCDWSDMLILAGIAGFSEEALFRGLLQPWLEQLTDMTWGLLLSNVVFALVHAVTPLYTLLAMLMGLYLGACLDYGGERNLLNPILVHALYDFVAFIVILRQYRNSLNTPDATH